MTRTNRLLTRLGVTILSSFLMAPALVAGNLDCVMMHDGKMTMLKDGKPAGPMDHEMAMSDGKTVMPDGTVRMKEGNEMHLKDGEMVMMDGHIMHGGKAAAMQP